jgi:membrane glycosyltransferase
MDRVNADRPVLHFPVLAPAPMPVHDFVTPPAQPCAMPSHPAVWPWRLLAFAVFLGLSGVVGTWFGRGLADDGTSPEEILFLALYMICFAWLSWGFAATVVGWIAVRRGTAAPGLTAVAPAAARLPPRGRTAVLMPLRNEDPSESLGRLRAIAEEVTALGLSRQFHWFILSDSNQPDVIAQEKQEWQRLSAALPETRVFYRNRTDNTGKKAGNIAEWCRNHGGGYDYMLILDADSVMPGRTLATLARLMDANPDAGIIQAPPGLTLGATRFSALRHTASRLYGQIASAGAALIAGSEANYYGHHAIIRVRAFTENAGLGTLSGKPPLGGPILSHDFVEAALIRRGGWRCWLAWDLEGAVEDSPPTLLDEARRDRRWCQGNMQHLRVMATPGLHWMSRIHLFSGAMGYLVSPVWLAMIVVGLWVMREPRPMLAEMLPSLLLITGVVLFGLKLLGLAKALADPAERPAGAVLREAFLEQVFATLTAPVMAVWHSQFVWQILSGKDGGWGAQPRGVRRLGWQELRSTHAAPVAFGLALAAGAALVSPAALPWLAPVILGLVLSPLLTVLTARGLRPQPRAVAGRPTAPVGLPDLPLDDAARAAA